MRDLMFDVPSDPTISEIVIDYDVVMGKKEPMIKRSSGDEKIA